MKLGVVVVVIAACSSKSEPAKPGKDTQGPPPVVVDADPRMVAVRRPVAAGPYSVAYDCSHSSQPFGRGSWSRNQSADLKAETWTTLEVTRTGEEEDRPGGPPPPPPPTVTPMSGGVKLQLATAIDKVLGAGPYREEIPVPEGIPCHLTIRAGDRVVFAIDKAYTEEPDLVNELVVLFQRSVGH